ncbi:MAG: translocation/assembly module TamB domain-containing protein, partial [Bacillota bacterium]
AYNHPQNKLTIKKGDIDYQDSQLSFSGNKKAENLNFEFNSSALVGEDINFTDKLEKLVGSTEVEGSLYGTIENPKAAAKFNAANLEYAQKLIGDLKGRVDYRNNNLYLTDLTVTTDTDHYQLNGSLNLEEKQFNQVDITAKQGTIDYVEQFYPAPVDLAYQFSGQVRVNGDFQAPKFNIEAVLEDDDQEGQLEVTGDYWWRKDSDLKLTANKFDIKAVNKFDLLPYNLAGDLNLTGTVTGKLTEPDFEAELKVKNGQIDNLDYQSLTGDIKMVSGQRIILDQHLQLEGEKAITAEGQIPLTAKEEFDFNLEMQQGSLNILAMLIPEIKETTGTGNANLEVKGTLEDPDLNGSAEVIAGSFSYPILDRKISNLNGKVEFNNNQLLIPELTGYYGSGNFSGSGEITLDGLNIAQYDLQLQGDEIAFEHGSWQGINDLDITITGTRLKPKFAGTIQAYDTEFELPVDWPKFSTGKGKDDSGAEIKPQLDLTITPEDNVRVVNDQIYILVQRGELDLITVEDEIVLRGQLNSNTGRFTYYNTEFEMEEGRAVFQQYDYIPTLEIEAETEIYDSAIAEDESNTARPYHTIYLGLTGPANQLNYQLDSDSNLTEEEIISLLTGQGGIGNLIDKDYEEALTAELRRVIGEGIKTEVIYKVERSFEKSLDLDQVRIKSPLEASDNIELEVGKFIFKDFMLKYNHSFLEETKAIGFEYYFSEGLDNLLIQGNYDNLGEYELGLEASIPFE